MLKMMTERGAAIIASFFVIITGAMAQTGQSSPWQLGMQKSASPSMDDLVWFHDLLLWIITIITLFVLGLLIWVCYRYSAKKNPVASKTTHHVGIEIAWTVIPVLILVMISIPSFRILFTQQDVSKPDITIKAIGKQWFWSYEYTDHGGFGFDQLMLDEKDRAKAIAAGGKAEENPRLLAVDNEVVLPIGKKIKVNMTASDVIHAWFIPAFAVNQDAVPGRMNSVWFRADKEGVFFGQCSQLCGKDHAFMPIKVRIVSQAKFEEWLVMAKKKYASTPDTQTFAEAK